MNNSGTRPIPGEKIKTPSTYTCNEYRLEMVLLALRQRLHQPDLAEQEREKLVKEVARLEKEIGF